MTNQKVIAITYASIGSGHRIAAQAIDEAIRERYPTAVTHLLDVLDFGARRIDSDMLTRTFSGPTGPIYDAVWDSVAVGRFVWGSTGWLTRRFYSRFTEELNGIDPDVVVCTHALGANIAIGSRIKLRRDKFSGRTFFTDKYYKDFPTVGVPTDYGVNASWPQAYLDLFCVGAPEIRAGLLARNVPPERVIVTGIPTRRAFGSHDGSASEKRRLRQKYGLPEDQHVTLALAGASMPGPYHKFKEYLSYALPELCAKPDSSLVVVTGKDEAYREELREYAKIPELCNLNVLGYVDDVADLMAASDLLICKPGGLTCTEGVCSGLPLLLVGAAVGQERVNVDFLGPRDIALHAKDGAELATCFSRLIDDPAHLARMKEAACVFRRTGAAANIADAVISLA